VREKACLGVGFRGVTVDRAANEHATGGQDVSLTRNYAVVARRFDPSRRRDNLSFQHHAEVRSLPDHQQDRWLDLAGENRWSKQELRLRIRRQVRIDSGEDATHVLRFTVDEEHADRWRQAAAECQCSLEAWVTRSLDAAALGQRLAAEP
jgi:hypothetical protein